MSLREKAERYIKRFTQATGLGFGQDFDRLREEVMAEFDRLESRVDKLEALFAPAARNTLTLPKKK